MNPIDPGRSERPNASAKPDTATDAASESDAAEQTADVDADRLGDGSPAAKPPLKINEIEDLERDVEGG